MYVKKRKTVPCLIIRAMDGKNDGLVTPESAMWGEFKGTLSNRKHRGISHGDMIDLTREDYRESYVFLSYVRKNFYHCLTTY
ncbi:hypothetical protein [Enterocloster clostridioformis]|jgi:triacylglycerol lipase|uniref:hypothetical protein n=1 Tax=Enterocloster clostridioformis TaxID=1531 RepID=UPI001A9A83E2|nr:hypothetical protein [Enterocloster clostridioformis]MCA5579981.1 hypothetical protein [Enterocloster clostridioformis]MDB2126979.1 hypothetical protein [Enterocloster clostridioformis]